MSGETLVPEKAHAELGASVAARWMACPGSVRLSRGIPNPDNEHSRAGTAAHAVAELCLRNGVEPEIYEGTTVEGVEVDEEMADAVRVFVQYCRDLMEETRAKWWVEHRFNLGKLNPPAPMYGTADFAVYKPLLRELEIVDYKNGSGVVVNARGNKQLRYYALGATLALGAGLDIDTVKMTIVQPRAAHPEGVVRSETMDYLDLLAFADELLTAARDTLRPDAPLSAGSHCRFCPASPVCPAQREQAQALAQVAFDAMPLDVPPAPDVLPPEVFADILGKLHILEDWAAAMRTHALRRLEAGETVPGFKLVAKRAIRRWKSEADAAAVLGNDLMLDDEELYKARELKSPAQVEKALTKDQKARMNAELVTKQSSGYTLVADSDPRPALELHAGDAFLALPPGND